jgi:hypothetical protein
MSAERERVGGTGDPVLDAVAGHGDPLIFEVPDMPPCMLHMMLRLEESRNKEQRKAGINYDTLDNPRASRSSRWATQLRSSMPLATGDGLRLSYQAGSFVAGSQHVDPRSHRKK